VSGTVQSVERAAAVLRLLAVESEPVALGQIAAAVGLAKTTAHGLLRTLHEVGFVEQDERTGCYRVSHELLNLGSTTLDLNEMRTLSLNWVDTLAARTGEAALLAAWRSGRVVVAHQVLRPVTGAARSAPFPPAATVPVVTPLALHATAVGKVLLAFDPGAARSIQGRELEALTFRTIIERQALQRELADVRDAGWAAAVEESEPYVAGIAAPVRDQLGYVVAAVGVRGSVGTVCDDRLRPRADLAAEVVDVARAVSRALGHGALR
jgi:DNA-binding IclR family transcriptional regulator